MLRPCALCGVLLALPAQADPAPDYYVEALFAVSTAERLAQVCAEVELDVEAALGAAEEALARLDADGITGEMVTQLTGIEAGGGALQDAFMAQYGLESPSESAICAAAQAEVTAESAVGAVLQDVRP